VGRRTAVASFVLDIVSKRRRLTVVGDCQGMDGSQVLGWLGWFGGFGRLSVALDRESVGGRN
jgi:hypothetical protein